MTRTQRSERGPTLARSLNGRRPMVDRLRDMLASWLGVDQLAASVDAHDEVLWQHTRGLGQLRRDLSRVHQPARFTGEQRRERVVALIPELDERDPA